MKALIDLDPLPYAYGGLTFDDGVIMPDSILRSMVDEKITSIVEASGADNWVGYLTDSGSNFRLDLATILPYKGNRAGLSKPPRYQMLRDYLLDAYPDNVKLVHGMEADDQLAIDQYKDYRRLSFRMLEKNAQLGTPFYREISEACKTIICTIDKDLMMVPGWHYNWKSDEVSFVTEVEGLRFFYKQLLTGDMTDNIRGLYGVGKKSKLLSDLDEMEEEEDMFKHVYAEYIKRFGNYADQFMLENGRLLWMLKKEGEMWIFPEITHEENEDDNLNDIPF